MEKEQRIIELENQIQNLIEELESLVDVKEIPNIIMAGIIQQIRLSRKFIEQEEILKDSIFSMNQLDAKDSSADRLEYIKKEIDFDALLNKYGPEGLYVISHELQRVADKDIEEGLKS